ncbi:uncharacterized protein LOC118194987 [Stegodyphus dumicola]|uniref:uncharacterized protein LOC118194987 n=1 Tax=Stegodyphus dumicola TaxID=202533 RepID=UPI0015A81C01|nr:uncharacterized protein LOC118194987 [Stegodyphus dumicola]
MDMMENLKGYTQDCINLALNLIHRGIDDVAYRLIVKSSDPQLNFGTNIFTKQLIKAGVETDKIIHYCNNIFEQGLNHMIYLNTAKAAADCENFGCASAIFQAMVKKGVPVRLHYFLPILYYYCEKKSVAGIYWVLKNMFKVGVCADFLLYARYVVPCVGVSHHPDDIISSIQETGQPVSTAVDALFEFYCYQGKLDYAVHLIEKHSIGIRTTFSIRQYLSHFNDLREKQYSQYFQVLNYIMKNVGLTEKDSKEVRGKFLAEILLTNQRAFDQFLRHRDNEVIVEICLCCFIDQIMLTALFF